MCHHLLLLHAEVPFPSLGFPFCSVLAEPPSSRLSPAPHPASSTQFGGCPGAVRSSLWDGAGLAAAGRHLAHGGKCAWAWHAPRVGSLFPAMPVLCGAEKQEKQGSLGPHCRELWCWQDPFSIGRRGAALQCCAWCHGCIPPVFEGDHAPLTGLAGPVAAHPVLLEHFPSGDPYGDEWLHPGPGGCSGLSPACPSPQARRPQGHLHINGLQWVCAGGS